MLFSIISYITSGNKQLMLYGIITLLLRVPCVLLALSIHEASHGYAAYKMGDPTARNMGRLTINPFKHLSPMGTISMLLFGVGWAKPVPINSRYFKNPKKGMAITAAAGPLSNLIQGIIGTVLTFLTGRLIFRYQTGVSVSKFPGTELAHQMADSDFFFNLSLNNIFSGEPLSILLGLLLLLFFTYTTLNFVLAFFNLIPIPPFDGSRLALAFLPDKIYFGLMKYEQYIMLGLMLLFIFGGNIVDTVFSFLIDIIFKCFFWILL